MAQQGANQPVHPGRPGGRRRGADASPSRAAPPSRRPNGPSRPRQRAAVDPQQYRAVVEDQTEVISRFKADGTFIFVNGVYCRFFGKTPRELIGKKWHPRAVAEDVPLIEAKLRTLSPANPVVVIENRVHAANGEVRWMQFVNRAFFDAAGRLVETQSVGRDITERKQAEQALRESEHRFVTIFRASPLPMGLSRLRDGRFLDVNEAFVQLYGYTREELIGHSSEELRLWHSANRNLVLDRLQDQAQRQTVELQARCKDGEIRDLLASLDLLELGGEACLLGVLVDTTERKRADEALRQLSANLDRQVAERTAALQASESLARAQYAELELLYRTAPVGLCHLDRALRYVRINDRLAAYNGKTIAEHLGRTLAEMLPDLAPTLMPLLQRVLTAGQPVLNVEFHAASLAEPGVVRDWIASYYPLQAGCGEVQGVSVVVSDITQTRQTEQALQQAHDRLQEAQKIAHLGSFEYAAATGTTVWSQEEYRIYGLDPAGPSPTYEEMLAKSIHPGDVGLLHDTFTKAIQNRAVYELEHRIVRPDGSVRWVHNRAQPYFDERGELVRYMGTTLDITERKQAEARMQMFSREIIAAREAERRQVSAALHHDAGSLAVGLSAHLDHIERAVGDGDPQTATDTIARTRKLLSETMGRLKRLAVELRPPELDTLGLPAALRQHFAQCEEHSGIRIRFRDSLGRRQVSEACASALFRIAQEAVTNTLKHGHARRVDVTLRVAKGGMTLTLTDDGCGFDPAARSAMAGAAMGLLVMKEMAALAGGGCVVDSAPGRGTIVRARLPLADRGLPQAGPGKRPGKPK